MKYNDVFTMSAGMEFEGDFCDVIHSYAVKNGFDYKKSSLREDKFEGTDFSLLGIRMDITVNFSGKDHMITATEAVELVKSGLSVQFGIRTGNNAKTFDEPVLVIGLNVLPSVLRSISETVLEDIRNQMDTIIDVSNDVYWNYIDSIATA